MHKVTIRDYIRGSKELTAAEVRKLPPGTKVVVHGFDRQGNHTTAEWTVVKSGNKKMLITHDWYGNRQIRKIVKENDRLCYTESVKWME